MRWRSLVKRMRTERPAGTGGGRLSAELSLPQLRRRWHRDQHRTGDLHRAFRFTVAERDALYRYAAREAADVAEHVRRTAAADPVGAWPRRLGGG